MKGLGACFRKEPPEVLGPWGLSHMKRVLYKNLTAELRCSLGQKGGEVRLQCEQNEAICLFVSVVLIWSPDLWIVKAALSLAYLQANYKYHVSNS